MKKVLASLVAVYCLTSGQAPPNSVANPPLPALPAYPGTTAIPPQTVPAQTTSTTVAPAQTTPSQTRPAETTRRPERTTTATPATTTTAAATTTTTTAPATTTTTSAATTTTAAATTISSTTTRAPRTPAPTLYFNRFCPAGSGIGKSTGWGSQDQACITNQGPGAIANDWQGRIRCNDFSCCQCSQINCGFQGYPCETAQFGDSGAVGVQSININGLDGYGLFQGNGAAMECNGLESCKKSKIRANYVYKAQCGGDFACQESEVVITNPAPMFEWQCNGLMSCLDLVLEIIIGTPGQQCTGNTGMIFEINTIEFNGQQTAQNARVAIYNYGCDQVLIRNLECMSITSCPNTEFIIEGNVMIETCDLSGLQNLNGLSPQLRACALGLGAQNIPPVYPPGQQLPIPPPPPPVNPVHPVNPVNPVNPGNPPFPVPVPPTPGTGTNLTPMMLPPGSTQQLKCDNALIRCAGQTVIMSPNNNFVLDCSAVGGCSGMTLELNLGLDPISGMPVENIDSLKFIGANSGAGATIIINNVLPYPGMIGFGDLRCENPGSCNGLTIIAGPGIDIWNTNFDCSEPVYCTGCTVKQGTMERSCNYQHQIGSFPFGSNPYGQNPYGQTPYGQPQQPGTGQPGIGGGFV